MGLVRRLRSFHRRRIAVPVARDALVLDVGSGDKPHWRADVLLDRFVGDEHGAQRSGRAGARVDRPLFDADATTMPFADGAFDYVICSHLLEHVEDPAGVIAELQRVGRAGYIEVPRVTSAKIADFPTHLWHCDLDDGVLVMTAKERPQFDPDIERFTAAPGVAQDLQRLFDRNFDECIVTLRWRGAIPHRVEGRPSAAMLEAVRTATVEHRGAEPIVARLLTAVLTAPHRRRRARPTHARVLPAGHPLASPLPLPSGVVRTSAAPGGSGQGGGTVSGRVRPE